MKRLLLIAGPGVLPFWAALVYVLYHGLVLVPPPDYWNQAPDLIVYSMPASVVTVLITLALIDVVERRRGR